MSIVINRQDATVRTPYLADTSIKPGGAGDRPLDPAKAAQQAAAETPVQAQSMLSQVIAEALDGDASEAMMRGALGLGKRDGLVDDDLQRAVKDVEETSGYRRAQPTSAPEVQENDQSVGKAATSTTVKGEGRTEAAGEMHSVSGKTPNVGSMADQHDQLMMLSSTMSRRDLATFLAQKHAARLKNIFKDETWSVQRDAPLMVTAAQMSG